MQQQQQQQQHLHMPSEPQPAAAARNPLSYVDDSYRFYSFLYSLSAVLDSLESIVQLLQSS
jgi:hypothetical protein